jgi:hypothetical protein
MIFSPYGKIIRNPNNVKVDLKTSDDFPLDHGNNDLCGYPGIFTWSTGFYHVCFGIGGLELIVHHCPLSPIYMYPFNLFNLFGMNFGVVSIY